MVKLEPLAHLEVLYDRALARAGLPYRSPSHRMAEQLAATAEAHAYAEALAVLTDDLKWRSAASRLALSLRDRTLLDQNDINQAEHDQGRLRRYGMHHLP